MSRPRPLLPLRVALLGLACGAAFACFAPGCFTPPADDVLFACEPEGDDSCPADYRCEADGCCHRIGSDLMGNWGGCSVSGSTGGTDSDGSDSGTDESSDTSDATDSTG